MRSVLDCPVPANLSVVHLRDRLIALTVDLADELATAGDGDRLEALADLYQQTRAALEQRRHGSGSLRVIR